MTANTFTVDANKYNQWSNPHCATNFFFTVFLFPSFIARLFASLLVVFDPFVDFTLIASVYFPNGTKWIGFGLMCRCTIRNKISIDCCSWTVPFVLIFFAVVDPKVSQTSVLVKHSHHLLSLLKPNLDFIWYRAIRSANEGGNNVKRNLFFWSNESSKTITFCFCYSFEQSNQSLGIFSSFFKKTSVNKWQSICNGGNITNRLIKMTF